MEKRVKEKGRKKRGEKRRKMVVSLFPKKMVTDHALKRAVEMNGKDQKSAS